MIESRLRRRYLWVLKNTLNRMTSRMARSGHGPFSLIRHKGRKTGKSYETPLILAAYEKDFIAELTYGPGVAWYRNIVAAGRCTVVFKGVEYEIDRIEQCDAEVGLRAFGYPAALVLRLLRRHEFRLLHTVNPAPMSGSRPRSVTVDPSPKGARTMYGRPGVR
jgi:deazaflavin-dependent oxidoreductase (nitroreductase family)